ncbi:MAG: hypothetical protein JWP77_1373 [Polaromonas sp.]|nr:hypothetical protein [Polaromonas sp.]
MPRPPRWHACLPAVLAAGLGLASGISTAQQAAPGAGSAAPASSAALGARLAAQGAPDNGVPACASCHGAQGEGMAAGGFPRLAGQSGAYLARQIESFRQDTRSHPVMSPIAKAMTPEQNLATAAYYAGLAAAPGDVAPASQPAASANAAAARPGADRGLRLASVGDDAAQVQACANCHGPAGAGEPPAYPYLAGQHAAYLASALGQWKSGSRKNDPSGQMPAIAARLTDADIAALAAYYASQPPPSRSLEASALPRAARNTPAGRGGPPAAQPAQGTGSEQGAPLTGGSQGPGGGGGTTGVNPAPAGGAAPAGSSGR